LATNKVVLSSSSVINDKGEKKDIIRRIIVQNPNTYSFFGWVPYRLWLYNLRYNSLHKRPDSLLPKTVERPVLYDSTLLPKSLLHIRSYLFNQGYFYADIKDTTIYRNKKAFKTYTINAGDNYLINKYNFDVDDTALLRCFQNEMEATELSHNRTFTFLLLDAERSRLTAIARNQGYYRFSQDNIGFVLDTLDKNYLKDLDNPLESALNFINLSKRNRKPTLDVNIIVHSADDSANRLHTISKVTVYPDYNGVADRTDTSLTETIQEGIRFRYHEPYVHSKVLAKRIFMRPGKFYSQDDYDRTVAKLNELGIFQFIRVQFQKAGSDTELNCNIYINRTRKYDFNANYEVSSGTTYQLGNSAGLSFRNKNFGRGGNLLAVSVNGGVELTYNDNVGREFFDHFALLTEYYGLNASLDFPKFIAPIRDRRFGNSSLPHTIVTAGTNVTDRVTYFTLVNSSAGFRYNWRETREKTWDVTPAFINIIRRPRTTALFDTILMGNSFLRNTYSNNFIEGENVTYTYTNAATRKGRNYTRFKAAVEEAGGALAVANQFNYSVNNLYKLQFAQYVKFDIDLQRFVNFRHSALAFKFLAGIGLPYDRQVTLPYIKQYFAGGPYSLRGWRIRSLGPGSYYDSANSSRSITLDRTGDIRLEWNGEYRFPVMPLFAGAVKMNGALFADAGNIWLTRTDSAIAGGEFALSKLGQDIAMDVGVGSRFEIASFLVFRLDAAIPVKKPYVPENNGWVLKDVDFRSANWRANNIIINISIGYPF